jgi:hypothetical protein
MPNTVEPDIALTRDQFLEATKLFLEGIRHGFADDRGGQVSLNKAADVLRTAFEMIRERSCADAGSIPIDRLNASNDD